MQENYIQILSTFLAVMLEEKKIELKDVIEILKDFEPICDNIRSREDLVEFLDKHIDKYYELKELKKQLKNKNYIFVFEKEE